MMAQKNKMAQKDQIEIDFASEVRIQSEISGWSPPRLAAMKDPMHQALLMACQIGDTSLCCALLSPGHALDFNRAAIVQDDQCDAASLAKTDPATTVLCMDSNKSFLEMGKMLGVATNIFVTTKAKPADFHVQNVNSYHERIKTWIDYRLRGVTSKYKPSYLA